MLTPATSACVGDVRSSHPDDMRLRAATRQRAALLAILAGVLALLLQAWDIEQVGITWDEMSYYESARHIQAWTGLALAGETSAWSESVIAEHWDFGHTWNPHPPFYKSAMALTNWLVAPLLGDVTGFRLASRGWFALLAALLAWTLARTAGLAAGLAAMLALLLMPRLLGHSFIAATDMPLTAFWFAASVGFAACANGGRWPWGVLGAAGIGAAMATKFTALLLPVPLLAWLLLAGCTSAWRRALAVIAGGLLVAVVLNPLAWHDPAGYLLGLVGESLAREQQIPVANYYFGQQFGYRMPWHYAPVMTLLTLPVTVLLMSMLGLPAALRLAATRVAASRLRQRRTGGFDLAALALLALLQCAFFMALMSLPASPKHDGVRLFLPVFPFIAVLAAIGLANGVGWLRRRFPGRPGALLSVTLFAGVYYPPYLQLMATSPFYLSYYNEAIGHTRGAVAAGLEATYWYDAITPGFLAAVNQALPPGAHLRTTPSSAYFRDLQWAGRLRRDIVVSDSPEAPWHLLYGRRANFSSLDFARVAHEQPVVAVFHQGVLLAGVYRTDHGGRGKTR